MRVTVSSSENNKSTNEAKCTYLTTEVFWKASFASAASNLRVNWPKPPSYEHNMHKEHVITLDWRGKFYGLQRHKLIQCAYIHERTDKNMNMCIIYGTHMYGDFKIFFVVNREVKLLVDCTTRDGNAYLAREHALLVRREDSLDTLCPIPCTAIRVRRIGSIGSIDVRCDLLHDDGTTTVSRGQRLVTDLT